MFFDFSAIPAEARDKLLHSAVVPRPIAWVSTEDREGRGNLAPFSFFNVFSADPPIIGLGIGQREPGMPKDTAKNILELREFVVNLVSYINRVEMNITGSTLPPGVDESELAQLEMVDSTLIKPRRVAASPVAIECVLDQTVQLGLHSQLILGRVVAMHFADDLITNAERYYIDTPKLDLIGRMHGSGWYTRTGDLFQMKRI